VGAFGHFIGVLGAVIASLGSAIWTSHATQNAQESAQRAALKQQITSFQQQRAIADRDELRSVLDQAAAALDTMMSDFDRMYFDWRVRPGRLPRSGKKVHADLERASKVNVRLAIRLSHDSSVYKNYGGAAQNALLAAQKMTLNRSSQDVATEVDSLRERALDYQDAFSNATLHLLSP
jgi:hypothetical protein